MILYPGLAENIFKKAKETNKMLKKEPSSYQKCLLFDI